MSMFDTSDLHKRVERYETAFEELRSAHQDIRTVLVDQVLYERWQQLGAELGFVPGSTPAAAVSQPAPQLSDAWAG